MWISAAPPKRFCAQGVGAPPVCADGRVSGFPHPRRVALCVTDTGSDRVYSSAYIWSAFLLTSDLSFRSLFMWAGPLKCLPMDRLHCRVSVLSPFRSRDHARGLYVWLYIWRELSFPITGCGPLREIINLFLFTYLFSARHLQPRFPESHPLSLPFGV